MGDTTRSSPWWYRRRGNVIGLIYGLGFALYWLPGATAEPAAVVWGGRLAAVGGVTSLLWFAVALGIIGWALRAGGTAYLRPEVMVGADARHDRLVVAGPFRHLRNPLYLGNDLVALDLGLMATPIGFAIVVLGNVAFGALLARFEGEVLRARYGEIYEAYARAVPPFVPRLTPGTVPGSTEVRPSLRDGMRGEIGMLVAGVSPAPIAIAGEAGVPYFFGLLIAGFVASVGLNFVSMLRAHRAEEASRSR
jgi:protein-S-isoprenylcysteine O-methyltransferase Ste14